MTTVNYASYLAFFLVCMVLLVLPFVPAYQEWRHPSDAKPLPISADYSNDIDHFAKRLHRDVAARRGHGLPTGYEQFDMVTSPVQGMDWSKASKRLISAGSIDTSASLRSTQPLYVEGSIRTGAECSFSALYATGDIELGAASEIHDWAHADGSVSLGNKCLALRRVSAGAVIELGSEAWFERLQAPTLRFGTRFKPASTFVQAEKEPASFSNLPGVVQQTASLFLVQGDCVLGANKLYRGSLIVTGFLTVGEGATIIGDIKAREGVSIGKGVLVEGAITCEKRLYVFQDAKVAGPLISENDILIGANAVIGLPDGQTSVSARNIILEEGVTVHGAVWAHEIGMVKSA